MPESTTPPDSSGLSRRDMLRRSALVGGTMVWMTPAVQTLASPAFAAATTVGENPCLCTFFLKYDPADVNNGLNGFSSSESSTHLPTCDPNGPAPSVAPTLQASGAGVSIVACGQTIGTASAVYDAAAPGKCVTVTFTGFTVSDDSSYFIVKDGGGNGCEPEDGGTFGSVTQSGSSFTFCGDTAPQQDLSHLNMTVCVTAFS